MQGEKFHQDKQLAEKIRGLKPEILLEWEKRTLLQVTAARSVSHLALRDSLPEYLDKLCDAFTQTDERAFDSAAIVACKHGEQRAKLKTYNLDQVIYEYQILRDIIIALVWSDLANSHESAQLLQKFIAAGIREAATRFRDKADIELKRSQQELYDFIIQAPAPMVVLLGKEMRFLIANPAYERLVGRKVVGKTVLEAFSEEEAGHFLPLLEGVYNTGIPFVGKELPLNIPDENGIVRSRFINLGYHAYRDSDGTVKGILADVQDVTEQVITRKLISFERHKLETIFQESPAAMALWRGKQLIFEMVNPQYQAIFSGRQLVGKPFLEAIPELKDQQFAGLILRVFETGEPFVGHEVLARHQRTSDGLVEDRYYDFTYSRVTDEFGNAYGVYDHAVDVTDRVLARKKLEESEAKYRESQERMEFALKSAKMGTWTVELPSRKTVLSEEAGRIFGYESEYKSTSVAIDKFLHPDYRESAKENLARAISDKIPYRDEILIVRPNGEVRWLDTRAQARYNENGEPILLSGIVMDITEQVEARNRVLETTKRLEQSELRFKNALKNGKMGSWEIRLPEGVLEVDDYFREFHHVPLRGEDLQTATARVGHPDDQKKVITALENTMKNRVPYACDYRVIKENGSYTWVRARGEPVVNEKNELIAISGIAFAIDDQKKFETELREAKKEAERASEAKSAFLANMSHEIRTPLGAIMGFSDLLRHSDLTIADRNEYLSVIDRNSHQLLRVIDDILDLAKVEAGKLNLEQVDFSITEQLADFASLMGFRARENGIQFALIAKTPLPERIKSDPVRIRQILNNIVGNAIKFTPAGSVDLEVSYQNGYFDFAVTDTGRGISPQQAANLFKPFVQADDSTTRKFGGTGLGLVLTKSLCHAFGGEFTLSRSELGQGSTFLARIRVGLASNTKIVPAHEIDFKVKPPRKSLDEQKRLRNLRILLVEDSPDNQVLVKVMTQKLGADISIASDGVQGIEMALAGDFDIVLMDIQMPRKDGHAATKELRARGYKTPIIALTAHAMKEEVQRTVESGFSGFVAKPIAREDLVQSILLHVLH